MIFVGIWFEYMKKMKVFVKPIAKKQSSVEREWYNWLNETQKNR